MGQKVSTIWFFHDFPGPVVCTQLR